jgi:hypothetical protein
MHFDRAVDNGTLADPVIGVWSELTAGGPLETLHRSIAMTRT